MLVATFVPVAVLVAPAWRETARDPAGRQAWRKDLYVIDAPGAARMLRHGERILFVDVRERKEHLEYRIPGSRCLPVRALRHADLREFLEADLVIPYCWKDLRGFEGARILRQRGVDHVGLLEGFGFNAWEAAGFPFAGTASGLSDAEALDRLGRMRLDRHR